MEIMLTIHLEFQEYPAATIHVSRVFARTSKRDRLYRGRRGHLLPERRRVFL